MRTSFLLFILVVMSNCSFAQSDQTADKIYSTPCQTFTIDSYFRVEETTTNVCYTFSDKTMLYCSPDETSEVVDTLWFNTQISSTDHIHRFVEDSIFAIDVATNKKRLVNTFMKETGHWYLINHNGKEGFIKHYDVATYVSNEPPFLAGFVDTNADLCMELRSFNKENPSRIVHTYKCLHYFHAFEIRSQLFNGLETPGSLVRYTTFTQSCPSATYHEFIQIDNGKFTSIASCMSGGEANLYQMEIVYLPLKFGNGKILLVADGDWENIFNYDTATLNTFNYPAQFGVPIENLIVITKEHTEEVLDANGEPVMENENDYKVKVIKEKPQYYRWDGQKLTQVIMKK